MQTYKPALKLLNQVDADVITFEMISSGAQDLEDVGREITDMKVAIGGDRPSHAAGGVAARRWRTWCGRR